MKVALIATVICFMSFSNCQTTNDTKTWEFRPNMPDTLFSPYKVNAAINIIRHNPCAYAKYLKATYGKTPEAFQKLKPIYTKLCSLKPMAPLEVGLLENIYAYRYMNGLRDFPTFEEKLKSAH